MDETKLIGWLCIFRLNLGDAPFMMPTTVREELIRRGWLESDDEEDLGEGKGCCVTDAGMVQTDLHAPDWGIGFDWMDDE